MQDDQNSPTASMLKFSETAANFFRGENWQVEVQPYMQALANGLISPRTSNRLDCADGRTANDPSLGPGYALFGGFWAIPALLTNLSLGGLRQAGQILADHGLEGVIHGDAHGDLNCGLFRLVQSNRLKALERNLYLLASHDTVLETVLRTLPFKVQRMALKGEHIENKLVMSFVKGYAPSLDPRNFRVTADLVDDLKIDREKFLRMCEETVRLLTNGALKQVMLINPA